MQSTQATQSDALAELLQRTRLQPSPQVAELSARHQAATQRASAKRLELAGMVRRPYHFDHEDYDHVQREIKNAETLHAKAAGFTCSEAKSAGLSCADVLREGFTCQEAKEAGYTLREVRSAGYSKGLKKAGYTIEELMNAGFTRQQVKKAGYTCSECIKAGWRPGECKLAGYTYEDVRGDYEFSEAAWNGHRPTTPYNMDRSGNPYEGPFVNGWGDYIDNW